MILGELEIERQLFQKFGSLAFGVSAGYVALLAWYTRDRSPRVAEPSDPPSS